MDFELKRDQVRERNFVKKQEKNKSESEESDELPVSVQQEIEDLCYYVPEVPNHFNVLDKIGEGTFSSVFLASLKHPNDIEEKFALKHVIPTSHPNRMIAELKCLQLFGGRENVMGVELCLKNRDHCVIVMRYFPHQKFMDYYNTFYVSDVRHYMINLLIALRHIHQLDIIHRDVKPTNFLHNVETRKYALVDFGLAQDAPVKLQEKNWNQPPIIAFSKSPEKENTSQSASPHARSAKTKRLFAQPSSQNSNGGSQRVSRSLQRAAVIKDDNAGRLQQQKPAVSMMMKGEGEGGKVKSANTMTMKGDEKTPAASSSRPGQSTPCRTAVQERVARVRPLDGKKKKMVRTRILKGDQQTTCMCYGHPSICSFCTQRPVETAHRAGTPGFRAPEVLMKNPNQTTAVDIWSAGVILLSLLSGRYPFFRGNDDMTCLSQIISLLGTEEVKKSALSYDKLITAKPVVRPLELKSLCERLRSSNGSAGGETSSKSGVKDAKDSGVVPIRPWAEVPDAAVELLQRMLDPNPATRITAQQALDSNFLVQH